MQLFHLSSARHSLMQKSALWKLSLEVPECIPQHPTTHTPPPQPIFFLQAQVAGGCSERGVLTSPLLRSFQGSNTLFSVYKHSTPPHLVSAASLEDKTSMLLLSFLLTEWSSNLFNYFENGLKEDGENCTYDIMPRKVLVPAYCWQKGNSQKGSSAMVVPSHAVKGDVEVKSWEAATRAGMCEDTACSMQWQLYCACFRQKRVKGFSHAAFWPLFLFSLRSKF